MLHSGDLQSGISLAITEKKLVACFVHSPADTDSATWETWLNNDILLDALSTKAVVLRIESGSTEASFLAAFCPIATTPTFVVVRNGQVLEKVEGGVSQEEFLARIGRAIGINISGNRRDETRMPPQQSSEPQQPQESIPPAATRQPQQEQPPPTDMTALFPDRAVRTSAHNEQVRSEEAAAKAARTAARKKEAEEAHAYHKNNQDKGKGKASEGTDKAKEAVRRDYMVQQSKAKQDAKSEKARILAQIEADRAERKARSQRAPADATPASSPMSPRAEAASRRMGAGGMCALQIRLFDGTSIKKRFEPSVTLEGAVREWVQAQEGVGQEPFTFKMLRAPLPSRTIEFGEENQSLLDLGLTPNATLMLVPVKGYTEAYDGNEGRGYMSSALHMAYGMASGATGLMGAALQYVPGFGPSGPSEGKVATGPSEAIRQERRPSSTGKKTEFYNGNSSAFEARKDDDEGKRN